MSAKLPAAFDMQGQRVLITGAAGGIGSETARLCSELGATLLLFANAFAAYATAAALVSQGAPITPLLIRSALTSEIVLGQADFGYALALEMVVVVAVVRARDPHRRGVLRAGRTRRRSAPRARPRPRRRRAVVARARADAPGDAPRRTTPPPPGRCVCG